MLFVIMCLLFLLVSLLGYVQWLWLFLDIFYTMYYLCIPTIATFVRIYTRMIAEDDVARFTSLVRARD